MNKKFNLIQEIEAALSIIVRKTNENDYITFLYSNELLKEYDDAVKNLEEESLEEDKLEQILKMSENKLKELL